MNNNTAQLDRQISDAIAKGQLNVATARVARAIVEVADVPLMPAVIVAARNLHADFVSVRQIRNYRFGGIAHDMVNAAIKNAIVEEVAA